MELTFLADWIEHNQIRTSQFTAEHLIRAYEQNRLRKYTPSYEKPNEAAMM
jgi:hypothetical protein